jgi:D-sedoheptulose 7-phosphate isomerase
MKALLRNNLEDHLELFRRLPDVSPVVEHAAELSATTFFAGRKLMLCGNGGSAADIDEVVSRQVAGLGRPGDCLLRTS